MACHCKGAADGRAVLETLGQRPGVLRLLQLSLCTSKQRVWCSAGTTVCMMASGGPGGDTPDAGMLQGSLPRHAPDAVQKACLASCCRGCSACKCIKQIHTALSHGRHKFAPRALATCTSLSVRSRAAAALKGSRSGPSSKASSISWWMSCKCVKQSAAEVRLLSGEACAFAGQFCSPAMLEPVKSTPIVPFPRRPRPGVSL